MNKKILSAIVGLFTLGTTSIYGQFVNPVVGGNVMLTTTTNNVVLGPLPTTPTNLYINNTATNTTILSIDNSYPGYAGRDSKLNFNFSGSTLFNFKASINPNCTSGYMFLGHTATLAPSIIMAKKTMLFTTDLGNQFCDNKLGTDFLFEGTTGVTQLEIGLTRATMYGTTYAFPSGYTFSVASGKSYFADKVAIGVTNQTLSGTHKLYVGGSIICEELVVKLQANWPDYVFSPNYKLMPLSQVKTYIDANNHLPDVPAACEVEENGVAASEMLTIQMKKIEELTLYLIQMEERIKQLEAQNKALQNVSGQ